MKVIFLKDHERHEEGDLAEVKRGFAQNFLFRKKIAVLADKAALLKWEKEKEVRAEKKNKQQEEEKKIIEKVNDADILFKMKVDENGKAFGSITKENVAKELKEKLGVDVKKHNLEMEVIKETGVFNAKVNFGKEVSASFRVNVERE